jgi:ribosomal protein S18 acetylase RimI-like enzyme
VVWLNVDREENRAFLYSINVYRQFRGKGYGRKIMEEVEKVAKSMDAKYIGLHVFAGNLVAINLYKTQGYRIASFNMQKELH